MALNLEEKKSLVQRLALHLSIEIWWTDHRDIMAAWLDKHIPPNANPNDPDPPVFTCEEARRNFTKELVRLMKEVPTDTVAVGMTRDGRRLVLAANIKKRTAEAIWGKGKREGAKPDPDKFGFFDRRHDAIIDRVCKVFPETESAMITVLETEKRPHDVFENASQHAEMQIIRYARQAGLDIEVMGISKLACQYCAEQLENATPPILYVYSDYNGDFVDPSQLSNSPEYKKVKNWMNPFDKDFGIVKTQGRLEMRWRVRDGPFVAYQPGTSMYSRL
jgi:hypothetical protein